MSYSFYLLIPLKFLLLFLLNSVSIPVSDIILASFLYQFIADLVPFLVLFFTGRKFLIENWEELNSKTKYFFAILLSFLVIELTIYLLSEIIYVPASTEGITVTNLSPLMVLLSTSSIMAAFTEEITFRYLFLKNFSSHQLRSWMLLFLSSILFGALHIFVAQSWMATIPYMFIGLVLGIEFIRYKNIWYPIGTHIVNNFFISVLPLIILYIQQLN